MNRCFDRNRHHLKTIVVICSSVLTSVMANIISARAITSLVNAFRPKMAKNAKFLATQTPTGISSTLPTIKKDKDYELMDPEEKEHKLKLSKTMLTIDQPIDDLTAFSGVPEEHIYERRVRISRGTKNAMQSGTFDTRKWRIEFDNRERWENPLMGWTSTGDPLSNLNVWFATKEEAAEFCEKNGYYYEIVEPERRRNLNKNYAENFSWNKRTRVGSK